MLSNPSGRPTEDVPLSAGGFFLTLAAMVALAVATYGFPFFGFPLSALLPVLAHHTRQRLWPASSSRTSLACCILAWVGLWWPAVVDMGGAFVGWSPFYDRGIEISTSWLLLPLAGPDSTAAWVWPALVAAGVIMLGLALSARSQRPWPWVMAAWVAPWVHLLVISQIPHTYMA